MQSKIVNTQRGALLVEMIVAFAIISMTLVVVTDSFLAAGRANRASLRYTELSDTLAFVLADMTREAHISDSYDDNGGASDQMIMTRIEGLNAQTAQDIVYRVSGGVLQKDVGGGGNWLDMTPPSVTVSHFVVVRDASMDRLMVNMQASHTDAGVGEAPVTLQTSLATRTL